MILWCAGYAMIRKVTYYSWFKHFFEATSYWFMKASIRYFQVGWAFSLNLIAAASYSATYISRGPRPWGKPSRTCTDVLDFMCVALEKCATYRKGQTGPAVVWRNVDECSSLCTTVELLPAHMPPAPRGLLEASDPAAGWYFKSVAASIKDCCARGVSFLEGQVKKSWNFSDDSSMQYYKNNQVKVMHHYCSNRVWYPSNDIKISTSRSAESPQYEPHVIFLQYLVKIVLRLQVSTLIELFQRTWGVIMHSIHATWINVNLLFSL
jgi:hypothetical protein